jgi:PAS domain S-box-containing protein
LNSATEAWLAAIVESSDDAIVGKTLDGVIRSWNRGAARTFGYSSDEAIGRPVLMLIPPDRRSEEDVILARLRRGERIEHFETVRQRKDGSCVEVSLSVSPILDPAGQIIGAAKIARDVSETKRLLIAERELTRRLQEQRMELAAQVAEGQSLQAELEETNEALVNALESAERAKLDAAAANRAKSQFMAMMSHELRTPLNAIMGYVQLLEMGVDGPVTEVQGDHLGRIRLSAQMLVRLIDEVLSFAKLESGRMTFDQSDVALNDILGRLRHFVDVQLAKQGIEYRVHPCPDGPIVRGDAGRIEQILLNLLSNAMKFTDRGRIEVHCAFDDAHARVSVSDTGRGIPRELHEKIFEPFEQGERDLKRPSVGTGLGLAISRQLARAMGGDVVVKSFPGEGSTFTLVLPRV